MADTEFARFRDKIAALPAVPSYNKQRLLVGDFLLETDDKTRSYYAPFDYVNTAARLAIVRLTPGSRSCPFPLPWLAGSASRPGHQDLPQHKAD